MEVCFKHLIKYTKYSKKKIELLSFNKAFQIKILKIQFFFFDTFV